MSTPGFKTGILGVPPSTASTKDSALIIIDAQNEYAIGKLKVTNATSSRRKIKELLDRYRSTGGQVIHVKHQVPEGAPVFTPGTELAEEFDELKPREGEKVIMKKFPGSFAETSLHDDLKGKGQKKVVLTGYMAHVCVSTTAREASQLGYEVLLPEDAIGDRDIPGAKGEDVTKMALLELNDAFATVIQSSEIQ